MHTIRNFTKRYPLWIYFILAIAPIWITIPLAVGNPALQAMMTLLSTAAPTIAALIVTAAAEGRPGLKALRERVLRWRVHPLGYVVAILLPVICVIAPIVFAQIIVSPTAYQPAPITTANQAVLSAVIVFALLEEIGWTGFALPRLLQRQSPLMVAVLLGFIHVLWHLPLWVFNPGLSYTILAGIVFTIAFRIIMVWLYQWTVGSVLIATLFHGAINTAGSLTLAGVDPAYMNWILSAGFVVVAVVVVALTGAQLTRKTAPVIKTQNAS